jgi:hypothetical protein
MGKYGPGQIRQSTLGNEVCRFQFPITRQSFQDVSPFYRPPLRDGGPIIFRYEHVNRGCRGAISFVPDAGKDYEVAFTWQGKTCRAALNEVVRNGDAVELIPVPVSVAPDC